jgi:hypothetical protein
MTTSGWKWRCVRLEDLNALHDAVVDPVQIVVSFEGIDPLAISMSALTKSETPRAIWVTDLADFLVVRDFLWDPGSFLHFAKARSDPSRPVPYVETDALGGYLADRPTASPDSAVTAVGPRPPVLRHNSGLINDYYTKAELGFPVELPGLGIPDEIRPALKATGERAKSTLWWQVASAVMEMTPVDWATWKRFHRRNRTDRVFTPSVRNVGIVLSSEAAEAEISAGDPPILAVPMPS